MEANKLAKGLKYSGRIDDCRLADLSLVSAYIQAVECYTPVTTDEEDGVINCLTEAEAEKVFENIGKITGLCFLPKNTNYKVEIEDDNNQFRKPTKTDGTFMQLTGGGDIFWNILEVEPIDWQSIQES
jgi:hypothetical protein